MGSPSAPDFERLLARLSEGLESAGLDFMLIGGQAVLLHGEPRLTQDIDITLGVGPDALGKVLAACEGMELVPLPEDVQSFVRETFVLPAADTRSGVRVDLIFSTTRYEAQAIERAVRVEVGGRRVPFASAEDLILHKLFAGRPRDIEDARGVVLRRRDQLDWPYLTLWAQEFSAVPGKEGIPAALSELRRR
jgi:hypothetical protein